MKKQILAALASVVTAAAMVPLPAFAEAGLVLSGEHVTAEAKPGTELTMQIEATQNAGYAVGTVDLRWDASALTMTSVDYTDAAPVSIPASIEEGHARVCVGDFIAADNFTDTGVFFTLHFTVADAAKAGEYTIVMERPDFCDASLTAVETEFVPGVVTLTGDVPPASYTLGDVSNDGAVNASDAAQILIAAANLGGGGASGLTEAQEKAAEINGDGSINASDAAIILQYAAAVGGGSDAKLEDFIRA